jgi:hypothetical protein
LKSGETYRYIRGISEEASCLGIDMVKQHVEINSEIEAG